MLSEKRISTPLTETQYDNQDLIEKVRQRETHLSKQIADIKQKINHIESKPTDKKSDQKPKLSRTADLVEYNDVTVTRLLAKRYGTRFNIENYQRLMRDLQVALMTLSVLVILVSAGWLILSNANFLVNSNFSYNVGLFGGFIMLCSIFYALLKRIKFINALGKNETWYYAHLICGIVGPLLILFHTSFHVKSINSGVASFTLFVILLSGFFGRYIFTLLSYQAHKVYLKIGEIELALITDLAQHNCSTTKNIKSSLTKLTVNGLKKPKTWWKNFLQILKVPLMTITFYRTFKRDIRKLYNQIAQHENWSRSERRKKRRAIKKMARRYAKKILWLSILSMMQNVLHNWRSLHANLIYLLILTASGHIVAVHMY